MPGLTLQEQQFQLQLAVPAVEEVTGGQAEQPAVFLSTSSHLRPPSGSPSHTGCFPSCAGRPGARHPTRSGTGSPHQPPTHFTWPQENFWLIKYRSFSQRHNGGWAGSRKHVWSGSQGPFSIKPDESIAHLQHPSPEERLTLPAYTAVSLSINITPISLAYFLKHLV